MPSKTTIYEFSSTELQDLKDQADTENPVEGMEKWVRQQYPIGTGRFVITDKGIRDGFTGFIEVTERNI